jgi:myosin heavy subunit
MVTCQCPYQYAAFSIGHMCVSVQELGDCQRQVSALQVELADVQSELRHKAGELTECKYQHDKRISEMEEEHQQLLNGMQLALGEANDRLQQQVDQACCERQELMCHHERLLDDAHAHSRLATQELEQVKQDHNMLRDEERALREQTEKLKAEVHSAERAVDALEIEHKSVVDQASHWCMRKDEEIEVRTGVHAIAVCYQTSLLATHVNLLTRCTSVSDRNAA